MSTLINRIQRAFLGSAGPEKVRALLTELAIPAGGSGENALREARRGFLRPISDEAILRDALSGLGLTGGGTGARPITRIRSAILHNLADSETTLRDGFNDLLDAGDLAGGGGGGVPEWVPEGAKIHIDFVGGDPQGRAWVEGTGEVAIETLLGNDPILDSAWGIPSVYDEAFLTADGYLSQDVVITGFIGAARTKLLAGATVRFVHKLIGVTPVVTNIPFVLVSTDGGDAVQMEAAIRVDGNAVSVYSFNGPLGAASVDDVLNTTVGALDVIAFTITDTRLEFTANGNAVLAKVLTEEDRPSSNPMTAALFDYRASHNYAAVQSITIYDPLPSTDGLSELSEI